MSKTSSLRAGRGIQVAVPEEHKFKLDEAALSELLLREDVRDCSVVVISVAGAFRKGKSFLLDFFLRYLNHKYNLGDAGGDWMGSEAEPLEGFSWRGGSERDTTGLLMWSQPFHAILPSGEKVVILLMDTQGTFDSESTVRDNATVFALSTMISSVQIYNLSQNIEEDDLQHLQLFTEYGRLAQQSISGKPFQRLQLLVRDWSFPYEHPYGAEGGQQLLVKRLEVQEGQHAELQALRRHVAACFQELACFLLPHPGLTVATDPRFNGSLAGTVSPPLTVATDPRFNGSLAGTATAEANNLSAVAEAREVYSALMEEICGGTRPYLPPDALQREHARARDKALHAFHARKKMGGEELAGVYTEQLTNELEEQFEQLAAHNEAKNIFKMAGTPLVLAALALLGYLVSSISSAMGIQTGVALGQILAITAAAMLALWGYSRITGRLREFAIQIDETAGTVKNYVTRQAWESVGPRAAAAAVGYSGDDKKRS
ncbi:hypothetical protein evm_005500 [Chilo suppressalis]|nr:hypothetical protein evm_005500 [Chilo suppressalis]